MMITTKPFSLPTQNFSKQPNNPTFEGNKLKETLLNAGAAGLILATPVGAAQAQEAPVAPPPQQAVPEQVYTETNPALENMPPMQTAPPIETYDPYSNYPTTSVYEPREPGIIEKTQDWASSDTGKKVLVGGGLGAAAATGIFLAIKFHAKPLKEEEIEARYGTEVLDLYKSLQANTSRQYHVASYVCKEISDDKPIPHLIEKFSNGEFIPEDVQAFKNMLRREVNSSTSTARANNSEICVDTNHWTTSVRKNNGTETTHYSQSFYEQTDPNSFATCPVIKQQVNLKTKPILIDLTVEANTIPGTRRAGIITSYTTFQEDPKPDNNN